MAAVSTGASPLTADGDVDVARADAEWLPTWKPLAHANPYAPTPDPDATANADAALRHSFMAAGMAAAEVDAMLLELAAALGA
jgi:hypothetical protein